MVQTKYGESGETFGALKEKRKTKRQRDRDTTRVPNESQQSLCLNQWRVFIYETRGLVMCWFYKRTFLTFLRHLQF